MSTAQRWAEEMPARQRKGVVSLWGLTIAVFVLTGLTDVPTAHAAQKARDRGKSQQATSHHSKKKHGTKKPRISAGASRDKAISKNTSINKQKLKAKPETKTVEPKDIGKPAPPASDAMMTLDIFLDRLMMAESGGNVYARNARSTALGPFQFIAATWLHLARTSFATETAELKPHEVLELRTDPEFARRAAKIYTESNAAHLIANGHKATFGNLRLAFLVGPGGAVKVLSAKATTPVAGILGRTVVGANPFMRTLTAADLIARSQRDISANAAVDTGLELSADAIAQAKAAKQASGPKIAVRCNLSMPSCRRWLALAKRRSARRIKSARRD